jgi:hypothetical protein
VVIEEEFLKYKTIKITLNQSGLNFPPAGMKNGEN